MTRSRIWRLAVAVTATLLSVGAVAAAGLTATWNGNVMTPDGQSFPVQFTLVQNGTQLTGTIVQDGQVQGTLTGTVTGNAVSFGGTVAGAPISFDGTIDGPTGALSVSMTFGGGTSDRVVFTPDTPAPAPGPAAEPIPDQPPADTATDEIQADDAGGGDGGDGGDG